MSMQNWAGRAGLLVALSALVLGCLGRSPSVRHYTMSPRAGQASGAIGGAVGLGPVSFPRHLERPQIVTRTSGAQLSFDEYNRWAGGFESNVVRVLADDLASRTGTPVVVDRSSSPLAIAYQVAVDIDEFEGRPGEQLVLRARFVTRERTGQKRVWTDESTVRQPIAGSDVESLVSAHDAALAQLADAIALRLASVSQ